MNKKSRNNRANQMNPNNPEYWRSRGLQVPRRNKVKVIVKKSHPKGNLGFACKLCGRRGKLSACNNSCYMFCEYCRGIFRV